MSIRTYRYVPPRRWQTYLKACLEILYPQYCPVCHHLLALEMEGICPDCLLSLPLYHDKLLHAADRLEGGAFPFDQLLAGYQFSRNNAVQEVSEITQKNKRSIEALAEEVGKFKV